MNLSLDSSFELLWCNSLGKKAKEHLHHRDNAMKNASAVNSQTKYTNVRCHLN